MSSADDARRNYVTPDEGSPSLTQAGAGGPKEDLGFKVTPDGKKVPAKVFINPNAISYQKEISDTDQNLFNQAVCKEEA